jgi:hypothetical protein
VAVCHALLLDRCLRLQRYKVDAMKDAKPLSVTLLQRSACVKVYADCQGSVGWMSHRSIHDKMQFYDR